jgi:hypothetical protein
MRAYKKDYNQKPEVKAKMRFVQIQRTLFKRELKPNIQQIIFNRLLKEERRNEKHSE